MQTFGSNPSISGDPSSGITLMYHHEDRNLPPGFLRCGRKQDLARGIKCLRSGILNMLFLVGVGWRDRYDDGQVPNHASYAQQLLFQHWSGPRCSHCSQCRSKTGLNGNGHVLTYFQKFSSVEFDSFEILNKECETRAHRVDRVTLALCKNVQAQEWVYHYKASTWSYPNWKAAKSIQYHPDDTFADFSLPCR